MEESAGEAAGASPERMLVFRVGDRRFGVGLQWVRSVSAHGEAGEEPGGGGGAAIDARALGWADDAVPPFGAPVTEILLGRGGRSVALLVDAVDGIEEAGEFRAWPRLIAAHVDPVFRGVALQPDGALVVVDAAALVPPEGPGAGGRAREA